MFVCGCLSVLRAIIMMMIYNADCAGRSWAKKIRTFRLVWRFLNAPSMRSTIPLDDIALRQRLWYCMKDDREGIDRSARIVGRDIFSPCRFDGPPGYTCCSSRTLVESFLRLQSPSFHSNTMGGKTGAISSSNNSRSRMRPRPTTMMRVLRVQFRLSLSFPIDWAALLV